MRIRLVTARAGEPCFSNGAEVDVVGTEYTATSVPRVVGEAWVAAGEAVVVEVEEVAVMQAEETATLRRPRRKRT
jgi:hypothetical protein